MSLLSPSRCRDFWPLSPQVLLRSNPHKRSHMPTVSSPHQTKHMNCRAVALQQQCTLPVRALILCVDIMTCMCRSRVTMLAVALTSVVTGAVPPPQAVLHADRLRGRSHVLVRHRGLHRRRCKDAFVFWHEPVLCSF